MNRRSVMRLGALAAAGFSLPGMAAAADSPEIIPLWPSVPPGGEGVALTARTAPDASGGAGDRDISGIARPTLTVFRPAAPDGSAILIVPGGGYSFEAIDAEGIFPALRFTQSGVTAFVLTYRLPSEGWKNGADVPMQDAQRAMRLIRARGMKDYGIDVARIGVIGFSAGGHLAASLATKSNRQTYAPLDKADEYDARPSFAALLYPVITMLPSYAHEASAEKLLGVKAPQALREAYSVERVVTADTPPCFLCAAADDPDVPAENTLMMFAALRTAKVPAEMHIFERGGHGFGLGGAAGSPAAAWPDLLSRWGVVHGFFSSAPSNF
jgi:acetyl esterase/lipase